MKLKVGVKAWRVEKWLGELIERGKPDFIETIAIVGEDYVGLKDFGLPITIHTEHLSFGINPADPMLLEKNIKSIEFAIKTADMLDASVIVAHPGFLVNHNCNMQNAIDFLKANYDPRIIVENMPNFTAKEGDVFNVGRGLDEMKIIMDKTKMGLCLDLSHAAVAAVDSGLDYKQVIRDFLQFKPGYFHISDSTLKSKQGDHLHLGEGETDILWFKRILPKNAWVVLETPLDIEGKLKDIEFMREHST
jgi:sugar phosphate isomerase/epimerase